MNRPPMRRCVGCGVSKPKNELIRLVHYEGKLSLDQSGRANGRGVYLCKNRDCLVNAYKRKGIQRSLKREIKPEDLKSVEEKLNGL